jgi:hypothetical protein
LRALVGDIQTLTSFLSLFLPFCFCHHYHLYPFKCVWFGFDETLIRCQWFLFLCWKTSQDFSFIAFISLLSKFKKQNKTKVWNSKEKEEEEEKKGVEHLVKINHKRDVSVYLRRRETRNRNLLYFLSSSFRSLERDTRSCPTDDESNWRRRIKKYRKKNI